MKPGKSLGWFCQKSEQADRTPRDKKNKAETRKMGRRTRTGIPETSGITNHTLRFGRDDENANEAHAVQSSWKHTGYKRLEHNI
jgi:PhoPQ-activated pathogenicity-related protein